MTVVDRAKYGAAAFEGLTGKLPTTFPRTMGPNAMRYLQDVVESGLRSDMTSRFEQRSAEEMGVKHCIATPGCTPAIFLLAMALDLAPGEEVIRQSGDRLRHDHGPAEGALHSRLCRCRAGHCQLECRHCRPLITDRTRAILVVHMTGIICDMDAINELATKHDLVVIEDVCQAVFGEYKGQLDGTLGHAAGFSFDSEKTLGSDVGAALLPMTTRSPSRRGSSVTAGGKRTRPASVGCTLPKARRCACQPARQRLCLRSSKSSESK
ncbi:MAG: hypothetical protein CL878_09445 [Dehalococcoidia bacterium]|nr:hypothetical protein [Dehalococcoidia bacterium]